VGRLIRQRLFDRQACAMAMRCMIVGWFSSMT